MKNERLAMRADAAMLAQLDSFRRGHPDLPSRSEAVRILVNIGTEVWIASNAPKSPAQAVAASAATHTAPKQSTAARKPAEGPGKAPFDRVAYQRTYMRKRREGVRWPKGMTPAQIEAVTKLVEELRPVMSSRAVKAAILERADTKVSHEFVETLARARGIPTGRPRKPPKG